jgi:tight adherence protein C
MVLFMVVTLIFVAAAAALAARAFSMPRAAAVENLEQIREYGFGGAEAESAESTGRLGYTLDETAGRIGRWVASQLASFREDELRAQLTMAGLYRIQPMTFLGYRALSTIVLPLVVLWLASIVGLSPLIIVVGTLLAIMAGWVLPMTFLRRKTERRFERVERTLPELIDVLVLTVEAGLGFNASMQLAAARTRGPLGDELRLTLQEQRLGLSTGAALANLMARCDTPSMRSFVRSVSQGEALGVSIGTILRNLALETRKRRRAHAEERAQRAPVKILFPLVFFIFPPIFVVVLYPAVHNFTSAFGG